ncbi:MAG: D-alanyl-D-alanine carboxypeptidase [Candidatus Portiera sp.]|nr:D-alanyl-D-alanine carboxypeptidase [Portiera sp.]
MLLTALGIFAVNSLVSAMELFGGTSQGEVKLYNNFTIGNQVAGDSQGGINISRIKQDGAVFTFDKSPPVRVRPDLSAEAYMIIDPHTGTDIISKNANKPLPPASLTKIMTAYVVATYISKGKLGIQDEVKVSPNALKTGKGGSRMFIEPGRLVTVDQLLLGLLAISGNDAAVALAEHVAGTETEFVKLMNDYAQDLGMVNCYFTNSHGLHDDKMLCSLNDLMLLCQSIITIYPAFYKRYFGVKRYSYAGINQSNRNRLLFYARKEIDGIKTGHTNEAGYNLIVSGVRNGYRTIAGVMGTKNQNHRDTEVRKMMDHAYIFYRRYLHYRQGEKIADIRVRRGKQNALTVGLSENLYSTLPYTEDDRFKVFIDIFGGTIRAPIAKGQEVAELKILFDNSDVVITRPLVALEAVEESSPVLSILDEILLWLGF